MTHGQVTEKLCRQSVQLHLHVMLSAWYLLQNQFKIEYMLEQPSSSKWKLNLFQSSSFSFRNPKCHKDNSKSRDQGVNCEGTCCNEGTVSVKHDTYMWTCRNNQTHRCIPPLFQFNSKFAVIVITQDVIQFANVAMLPARPLMFTGSIWKCASWVPKRKYFSTSNFKMNHFNIFLF